MNIHTSLRQICFQEKFPVECEALMIIFQNFICKIHNCMENILTASERLKVAPFCAY